MRVELTELFWHDEQKDVSLTELSELSGLSEAELQELVDCGAIVPAAPEPGEGVFRAKCIVAAKTASRLRNDFELDVQGIAVTLTLLDQIHELKAELRDIRAQLPRWIR